MKNGLADSGLEGDVEDVMARPIGDGADVQAEKEKWYGLWLDFWGMELWNPFSDLMLHLLGTHGISNAAYHGQRRSDDTYLLS